MLPSRITTALAVYYDRYETSVYYGRYVTYDTGTKAQGGRLFCFGWAYAHAYGHCMYITQTPTPKPPK